MFCSLLCAFFAIIFLIYAASRITMGIVRNSVCLVGKTAIVTGGNEGIGYQVVHQLASRGCKVIIADVVNAEDSKNRIIRETGNPNIIAKHVDLRSFQSVREFAKDIIKNEKELHLLIHNAGVSFMPIKTEDGINATFQINFYSPFLLNHLLLDLLKKSAPSRIIMTSSGACFLNDLSAKCLNPDYGQFSFWHCSSVYGSSKLCNLIVAREFGYRLKGSGVTVNSLHPGIVRTRTISKAYDFLSQPKFEYIWLLLWNFITYIGGKDPWQGSQTTVYLAVSTDVEGVTGKHFWDCLPLPVLPLKAYDQELCKVVWNTAEEYTKLEDSQKLRIN